MHKNFTIELAGFSR